MITTTTKVGASILSSNNDLIIGSKAAFGLISEYNRRANIKLNGTHLIPEKAQFFTTSSRPGNFGDHVDFKLQIDNWFDENRAHNEH